MAKKEKKKSDDIMEMTAGQGCGCDERSECSRCDGCAEDEFDPDDEKTWFGGLMQDCIFVEEGYPVVLVTSEGSTYMGSLVLLTNTDYVALLRPLKYVEALDQKTRTLMGGLIKPYSQIAAPNDMMVKASAIIVLHSTSPKDMSLVQHYSEMIQKYSAEDVGLALPPEGLVIGRA